MEHLIKKYHLKYSLSVILTALSIYFWITLLNLDFLKIIGLVINIAGLTIWWSAKITLAENWGIGFGKPQIKKLVTHGIYSKIRHPMYLGVNLTLFGLVLIYPKAWFMVISLLIIVYFLKRMETEDKYLIKNLGEEYQKYREKTWI